MPAAGESVTVTGMMEGVEAGGDQVEQDRVPGPLEGFVETLCWLVESAYLACWEQELPMVSGR